MSDFSVEITGNLPNSNISFENRSTHVPSEFELFFKNNVANMEVVEGKLNIPDRFKRIKIDIGLSHKAPHIREWLSHEKDLLVFGFEPRKDCVALLNKDNIDGAVVIPCALFDVTEPTIMKFNVTKNPHNDDGGASSLFDPKSEWEKKLIVKEQISVHVFNLKMFFDLIPWGKNNIEYVEYIKIDAQGADINILMSCEQYLKDRVVYVTAEPDGHCYTGADNNNAMAIINYMKKIGFEYVSHPNTKDPTFINKKYWDLRDKVYIKQKDY